mmetsp:Transcript_137534/g.343165  ORF Transcript_137534/g.343165 Transcript_137534/m.343165 type:complete len:228 (-) Transcript_137534:156-839(-)
MRIHIHIALVLIGRKLPILALRTIACVIGLPNLQKGRHLDVHICQGPRREEDQDVQASRGQDKYGDIKHNGAQAFTGQKTDDGNAKRDNVQSEIDYKLQTQVPILPVELAPCNFLGACVQLPLLDGFPHLSQQCSAIQLKGVCTCCITPQPEARSRNLANEGCPNPRLSHSLEDPKGNSPIHVTRREEVGVPPYPPSEDMIGTRGQDDAQCDPEQISMEDCVEADPA